MIIEAICPFFDFCFQESVRLHLTKDIIQFHKESPGGLITRERSGVGCFSREYATYN
jgi:hypothetical protein